MKINKLKSITISVCCLISALWSETQGMDMDELRSRFVTPQPGGRVMQRDVRLIAHVEIIDSVNINKRGQKFPWMFTGPLPYNYASQLTQPILTALRDCPENIRDILGQDHCSLSFTFDIAGSMHGPVIGQSGILVNDQNGLPGRCITIIDKNDLLTEIFW
jgi:hypothetical protein